MKTTPPHQDGVIPAERMERFNRWYAIICGIGVLWLGYALAMEFLSK